MSEALDAWNPVSKAFVDTTPAGGVIDWPLLWRDPHPRWTSPAGHVVQVGDSAHFFLPDSGNGATQAMEDSISLATCLQLGGKSNVGLATKVHSKLRYVIRTCLLHHTNFADVLQLRTCNTGSKTRICEPTSTDGNKLGGCE